MESETTKLVKRLRNRDTAAFDEVYARYHERIFRFLCRLAGSRHIAEDLFQETWIQVARDAHTMAEGSDLSAWLFAVARNRHKSYRRWSLLDIRRIFSFASEAEESAPSPEREIAARAEAQLAKEAFSGLSPAFKEVLLLSVGEGFDAPRVAETLGISAEAARQRLSRARAELLSSIERGKREGPRRQVST